jgi:pyruvate/oxaloacetate carboxyltransferase
MLPAVPALVDTTLRLLGQEPLAAVMPTSAQLDLAAILDGAGFAYLEVSGGGCFDSAVKRGVESPWERIRAIRSRTNTAGARHSVAGSSSAPGRSAAASSPVRPSSAASGIDVFAFTTR